MNNSQIDLIKNFNFDILVIDGGFDRFNSLNLSLPYLSEIGIVIIDNSEGYYDGNGINEYGYFPMLKLMKSKNFKRIDFFGYAPGVIIPHTTSIFSEIVLLFLIKTTILKFQAEACIIMIEKLKI